MQLQVAARDQSEIGRPLTIGGGHWKLRAGYHPGPRRPNTGLKYVMHELDRKCATYQNGQNHGFARAIEISRFFRDLIIVEASEMNNTVGFIFISASKRFSFVLVCFQHSNSMQSVSSTF